MARSRTRGRFGRPTAKDASSGFVTGLFSIPEGMAYASLGGFAAPMGLWSGAVPTIVGSFFSRTVLMVTTLTSATALASQSILGAAGLDPGDLGGVATLTVLVGLVMLVMGLLRMGAVMAFVSTAVMTGFTTGIAVQIVAGVMGDATGYDPERSNTLGKIVETLAHVGQWDLATVAVAGATVALWAVVRAVRALRATATLVALVVVSAVAAVAGLDVVRVSDIAAIPRSLPPITIPDLAAVPALATGAVAIALVALAQAAGIAAAVPNPDGSRSDVSGDFRAQGAANVAGGFFGALPTGGSLSRTGVATSGGARTRWAGIFAGVSLIVLVLVLGPVAGNIPMAVIGGLLLVIGGELIHGRMADIKLVLRTSGPSSVAMIATFIATTQLPLQYAIFCGAGLSILLYAVQAARSGRLVQLVPTDDGDWRLEDPPAELPSDATTVLHYTGHGFFAEALRLDSQWPDDSSTRRAAIVLSVRDAAGVPSSTLIKLFQRQVESWQDHGIRVVVCDVSGSVRERLQRVGLLERLDDDVVGTTGTILGSLAEAFERAERKRLDDCNATHDSQDPASPEGPDREEPA